MLLQQRLRHFFQRTEIGQRIRRARAEHERHADGFVHAAALTPHREGAKRRRSGSRADHQQARLRIVRHQEGRAERPDDADLVALLQIADIVGGDAARLALHGQREIVEIRPLAVARTRYRIKSRQMRFAAGVHAGGNDAEALPLEHRKRLGAEVENDVTHVAVGAVRGQAVISLHGRLGGLRQRVEIDGGLRRRAWRFRPAARAAVRLGQ